METRKFVLAATLALAGALITGCGEDELAQTESTSSENTNAENTSGEMATGAVEPANPAEGGAPLVPEDEVGTAADVTVRSGDGADPVEPTSENTTTGQDSQNDPQTREGQAVEQGAEENIQ